MPIASLLAPIASPLDFPGVVRRQIRCSASADMTHLAPGARCVAVGSETLTPQKKMRKIHGFHVIYASFLEGSAE